MRSARPVLSRPWSDVSDAAGRTGAQPARRGPPGLPIWVGAGVGGRHRAGKPEGLPPGCVEAVVRQQAERGPRLADVQTVCGEGGRHDLVVQAAGGEGLRVGVPPQAGPPGRPSRPCAACPGPGAPRSTGSSRGRSGDGGGRRGGPGGRMRMWCTGSLRQAGREPERLPRPRPAPGTPNPVTSKPTPGRKYAVAGSCPWSPEPSKVSTRCEVRSEDLAGLSMST